MLDFRRMKTVALVLLALKPWTTHGLVPQVDRSLRRIWPRARSKLYEEPKKLVDHGLATATAVWLPSLAAGAEQGAETRAE